MKRGVGPTPKETTPTVYHTWYGLGGNTHTTLSLIPSAPDPFGTLLPLSGLVGREDKQPSARAAGGRESEAQPVIVLVSIVLHFQDCT